MRKFGVPFAIRFGLVAAAVFAVSAAILVTTSVRTAGANEQASASSAPVASALPGRLVFARGGDIWHLVDGKVEPVTREGGWRQPRLSPDGTQIAAIGLYTSASEVFVLDADGSGYRQLTRNRRLPSSQSDWAFHPTWSPDGGSLAFVTDRSSFYPMLWRMNPDGTGARQLTFPTNGLDAYDSFAWSPDGRQLAATRYGVSAPQIHLLDVSRPAGARAITRFEAGAMDPAWSPDGQYLAYVAREGARSTVYIVNVESLDQPVALADAELARGPTWSPGGNTVAYIGFTGNTFEIFSVDLTERDGLLAPAGRPSQVTVQFGVDAVSGLSWGW